MIKGAQAEAAGIFNLVKMLTPYYRRGWDPETRKRGDAKLKELGLAAV